jgi:hypothetical protein
MWFFYAGLVVWRQIFEWWMEMEVQNQSRSHGTPPKEEPGSFEQTATKSNTTTTLQREKRQLLQLLFIVF